jgi:hypothetical protein
LIISISIFPIKSSLVILKESAGFPILNMGGVMMTQLTVYKSMSLFYGVAVIGTIFNLIAGYYLALQFQPTVQLDLFSFIGVFLGIPVLVAFVSFYFGMHNKKNIVEYHSPKWDLKPVQMTIEDAKKLPGKYNRKYSRLVANSHFWYFFVPILLMILIVALPLYGFFEDANLSEYVPPSIAISMATLFLINVFGAFRAISNPASSDFTLPLIREAVKLAEIQSKVAGICNVRVVLDKAEDGELAVYDNPRVIARIKGLENEAYVESWSDDLRTVTKVLGRLYEKDGHPQVVWWWFSTDRFFRKFVNPDENGYYVKYLVRTNIHHPGVKDVSLITQNIVALILREYLKTRGESVELSELLKNLNVENH